MVDNFFTNSPSVLEPGARSPSVRALKQLNDAKIQLDEVARVK